MKRLNQQGYNLVELAIAVLIMGVMAASVLTARSYMAKQTVKNSDKAYATQKAIQMFEELKTLVNGNEQLGVAILDNYGDGSKFNTVLTTDKTVDVGSVASNPADPLSGNRTTDGNWRYLRQIQINRVANDPYTRQAIVKIWRYASDSQPNQPGELLATVGGMLRTIQALFPPTQVMDIYMLALNNVPGWWVQVPQIRAVFEDVVDDIQSRNPGLEIRTHIISRTSYGRDQQYNPFINKTSGTDVTPANWVYLYPGLAPNDAGVEQFFYDPGPTGIQSNGTVNVDGTLIDPTTSQFSTSPNYSVADQYNHGLRYPDEVSTYQAVTAAWTAATAAAGGISPCPFPEISERMLMEGMLSSPQSFRNAMIVNLHGELFPLPPIRNYSDPAKDPVSFPNVRVVTHPELIYYPTAGTATVKLRVYAYFDGFDNPLLALPADGPGQRVPALSVFLPDLNLTSASVSVAAIVGMYNGGGAVTNYKLDAMPFSSGMAADNNAVSWSIQTVGAGSNQTKINLYNTSLRCPIAPNNTGLNAAYQLYNSEYIPCSPEVTASLTTFPYTFTAQDLTDATSAHAKNTARWIITLSNVPVTAMVAGGGTVAHVVETRLGNAVTTNNVPINAEQPNMSRTYFWVGNTNPPPVTEQFQFMGDPRDCPYLDVKVGGVKLGAGQSSTIQNDGYNWYFKCLNTGGTNVDGYYGFDQAGNGITGWGDQHVEIDAPRYFQMFRNGLLNTTSIFAGINGLNEFYLGLGGEMGANTAPFSSGPMYRLQPWNLGGSANICEMLQTAQAGWVAAGTLVNKRVIASTTTPWYAKNWLGELYPDSLYSTWKTSGNLPSTANPGVFPLDFYRKTHGSVASLGSVSGFGRDFGSIAERSANASFLNGSSTGGTGGNWFQQQAPASGNATIYNLAATCYGITQFPLGSVINCNREWSINWTGANNTTGSPKPSEWAIAPYDSKPTMTIPAVGLLSRLFYNSDDAGGSGPWNGAGVIQLDTGTKRAYYVVSGLSPSANTGVAELGKTVLVCILRTFFDGGLMGATGTYGHITQLPLVQLWTSPVPQYANPTTIPMVISSPVTTASPVTINGLTLANAPVTDIWFRYPGVTSNTGNVYTEEYPNYALPLTQINGSTYYEPVSIVYNLKYSGDTGKTWRFMQDGGTASKGIVDTSGTRAMTVSGSNAVTWYNWDVSNTATFPQGNYWMMVEAYRLNNTTAQLYNQHYSYHTVDVTINR